MELGFDVTFCVDWFRFVVDALLVVLDLLLPVGLLRISFRCFWLIDVYLGGYACTLHFLLTGRFFERFLCICCFVDFWFCGGLGCFVCFSFVVFFSCDCGPVLCLLGLLGLVYD